MLCNSSTHSVLVILWMLFISLLLPLMCLGFYLCICGSFVRRSEASRSQVTVVHVWSDWKVSRGVERNFGVNSTFRFRALAAFTPFIYFFGHDDFGSLTTALPMNQNNEVNIIEKLLNNYHTGNTACRIMITMYCIIIGNAFIVTHENSYLVYKIN